MSYLVAAPEFLASAATDHCEHKPEPRRAEENRKRALEQIGLAVGGWAERVGLSGYRPLSRQREKCGVWGRAAFRPESSSRSPAPFSAASPAALQESQLRGSSARTRCNLRQQPALFLSSSADECFAGNPLRP